MRMVTLNYKIHTFYNLLAYLMKEKYILLKLVDDEWWEYGTYHDVCTLAMAAHQLGLDKIEQIRVEVVKHDV